MEPTSSEINERFNAAYEDWANYPNTLLRVIRPHEIFQHDRHHERLQENEEQELFDSEEPKIEFWETDATNGFHEETATSVASLRTHFKTNQNDPQIRHAFLESDDSRSPLNCSPDMLKALLTYHQVEPSFLDSVYAFGEQDDPKDMCLSSFTSHDTLAGPENTALRVPQLGRSGRQIHISYLLRSIEFKKNRYWPWQIRQAAVYHSFDTETGRSFWFTVKGNDEFNRRVKQGARCLELSNISADPNDQKCATASFFNITLATHLVYLSWCDENWREVIDNVEDGTREILNRARKAPIDSKADKSAKLATYPKFLRDSRSRVSTVHSSRPSRSNTGIISMTAPQKRPSWAVVGATVDCLKHLKAFHRSGDKTALTDPEKAALHGDSVPKGDADEPLVDVREILDQFRFSDLQTLHTFSDRIRRAILTLKLDISTLHEIHDYYNGLFVSDTHDFRHIREACKESIAEFLREVRSISRRLEARKTQFECLSALVAEGIVLYDGVLQYRQLDISKRFQETAQESADQMQEVANKTKLETASMHVITIVTLIFLPATFVCSGVFFWNPNAPAGMSQAYLYRGDGFRLFVKVAVPLMVVTLGVWLTVFLSMRRNMENLKKRRLLDVEAAEESVTA